MASRWTRSDRSALLVFMLVAFAGSASVALAMAYSGQPFRGGLARAVAVIYTMPLVLGSLVAQGVIRRRSIRDAFAFRLPRLKWLGLAWLTPLLWLALGVFLAVYFGDAEPVFEREALIEHFGPQLHVESRSAFAAFVRNTTLHPFALQIAWGLFAGTTLAALSALADEMVWRGFLFSLLRERVSMGTAMLAVGLLSALWYLPLVYLGYLYDQPANLAALALAALWFFSLSLPASCLRVFSNSTVPVAILRGTLFSLSTFPSFALRDLDLFLSGPFGIAGSVALLLVGVILVVPLLSFSSSSLRGRFSVTERVP